MLGCGYPQFLQAKRGFCPVFQGFYAPTSEFGWKIREVLAQKTIDLM
jgi:hypothetical protein